MSQQEKKPLRSFSGLPFYLALIVIMVVTSFFFFDNSTQKTTSLSEALDQIEDTEVEKQDVVLNGNTLIFKYIDKETGKKMEVSKKVPYDSMDHTLTILMNAKKKGAIET